MSMTNFMTALAPPPGAIVRTAILMDDGTPLIAVVYRLADLLRAGVILDVHLGVHIPTVGYFAPSALSWMMSALMAEMQALLVLETVRASVSPGSSIKLVAFEPVFIAHADMPDLPTVLARVQQIQGRTALEQLRRMGSHSPPAAAAAGSSSDPLMGVNERIAREFSLSPIAPLRRALATYDLLIGSVRNVLRYVASQQAPGRTALGDPSARLYLS